MGFLKGIGCGDDSLLFFILIFLVLFCTDIFNCGDRDDCCGGDNSILVFIILFLLLFNGNGCGCGEHRELECGC